MSGPRRKRSESSRGYKPPEDAEQWVELSKPIKAWGEDVTTLGFREPNLGDLEAIEFTEEGKPKLGMKDINRLIHSLAAIPESSVRRIKLSDLDAISEVIGGFFGVGPEAGGDTPESSP
jgi:hypothetical protein